jgi:hypothetical protein
MTLTDRFQRNHGFRSAGVWVGRARRRADKTPAGKSFSKFDTTTLFLQGCQNMSVICIHNRIFRRQAVIFFANLSSIFNLWIGLTAWRPCLATPQLALGNVFSLPPVHVW